MAGSLNPDLPIQPEFAGDTNDELCALQTQSLSGFIQALFDRAKVRYLRAARVLDVETDLYQKVKAVEEPTQPLGLAALRPIALRIARHYRFVHDPRGQMPLPFEEETYSEWLHRRWREFSTDESARLIAENDSLPRLVLESVLSDRSFSALSDLIEAVYSPLEERFAARSKPDVDPDSLAD